MGKKIAFILLIVVICGIVLYVASSNIFGKLGGMLSSLAPKPPTTVYSNTAPSSGGSTLSSGSPSWTSGSASASTSVAANQQPTTPTINPSDIPAGYTLAQLSPFFHQITFGSLYSGDVYSYGQISLYDSSQATTTSIDVTGWEIKSNRGGEYIPTAINLYDPSGLTAPGDIRMQSNQTLNIYSDTAPFNLRLNKCIGYMQNSNPFNPPLPTDCPYVSQSDISTFTGVCQQYVYSLGSCQLPDMNNISIPETDYACRTYLENLNYGGCFAKHVNDSDFLSNEWRVWMGSNVIDPVHDTVLLLDRNGLLVDLRTY
jgi:hypothetical protein